MQTGRPVTITPYELVAAPHYLAAQAGLQILGEGGNAIDAAVATAATLSVVMPHQTSLGGDAFWLIYKAGARHLHALNASGRSPANLSPAALPAHGRQHLPVRGPLPVTVPGVVDGWITSLRAHGTLPLSKVLEPAIDYAENGFPINVELVRTIHQYQDELKTFKTWREIFLPGGVAPQVGDRFSQKQLAQTLRAIAGGGRAAFYNGEIARKIATCIQAQGGFLAERDLAEHRSVWVEPFSTVYRGYEVYQMPPNSRGAIVLLALNLLEQLDLPALGFLSPAAVHALIEAYRLAKEQIEPFCCDPDFAVGGSPLAGLFAKEFAATLYPQLNLERTTSFAGEPAGDTVYLAVVDREGNAVSLIESSYYTFGSGLVVDEAGFILQNRGAQFSLDPDHPNRLEPRKRPLHTLMPAMAFRDGAPWLVFGTMGGAGQAQTQLQLLTHLIDFGLNVQQALEAPRWVKGGTLVAEASEALRLEDRFPLETRQALGRYGYSLDPLGDRSDRTGQAQMILIDHDRQALHGGADPRGEGMAVGR